MSKKRKGKMTRERPRDTQERTNRERLAMWQQRLADSNREFSQETERMDKRELLYKGDDKLKPVVDGETGGKKATHVRNIVLEHIESQVSSSLPMPKVTPRRKEDERLAQIIENWIRNEMDRLPFETINDMAERTTPIQGGVGYLIEWDNTKRTHTIIGEPDISLVHPKQLAPQPGIYTGIEDMDWIIVKIPTTRAAVRRKYDVDVTNESESEPGIRSASSESRSEEALTQYVGYEKNDDGGINRFSWVNDIVLEDLTNYQARRQPVCRKCGKMRPLPGQILRNNVAPGNLMPDPNRGFVGSLAEEAVKEHAAGLLMASQLADQMVTPEMVEEEDFLQAVGQQATEPEIYRYDGGPCPWCGSSDWDSREQEYEQVLVPIKTALGKEIPGEHPGVDEEGNAVMVPTMIPFYRPDIYPIILQRNVSVYGQLLGNSDVDVIEDQQNTTNRLNKKIIDRILKAGTRVTLPPQSNLRIDPEDMEKWYINNAGDKAMIGVYDFSGDLQYEMAYSSQVYEESRQLLGITDAFQGRKDPTATSGKAKEYSAAMSAGRFESKRVMRQAAYAKIFELMFKYMLAYADEPRPVTFKNFKGETDYEEFNRYDFLEQDSEGNWYWNDQFLFSCDTAGPLANNREAMWQETRMNLQTGAFGDPNNTETLILFWTKMELLHYPGAAETKQYLEQKLQREQQAQQMQLQMQQQMQQRQLAAQQQRQAQQAAAPQQAGNVSESGTTVPGP